MLLMALLLTGWAVSYAQSNNAVDQVVTKTVKFKVTGMTCGGCANHISKALQNLNGVIEQDVEFPGDVAIVTFDPKKLAEKQIIRAIEDAGYKAEVLKSQKGKSKKERS